MQRSKNTVDDTAAQSILSAPIRLHTLIERLESPSYLAMLGYERSGETDGWIVMINWLEGNHLVD